ncbi:MAG: PspC domain-containing protein [Calditrichaeota bacterium]|nr:PspC domain-containing protein [Calditrichota bacterium]
MTKLYRSRTDSVISGLCGGVGETYQIDPTIVRLAVVAIGIFTGIFPVMIIYLVAWAVVPLAPPK